MAHIAASAHPVLLFWRALRAWKYCIIHIRVFARVHTPETFSLVFRGGGRTVRKKRLQKHTLMVIMECELC